nr:hypothetical protein Iba_chr12aCG9670 [Ipomoea batatas]GMD63480.1 hypothetical protein Iba_chr12bCG15260 [Ipomoea batatas]GMD68328.1 hypothetical protein Iba_chr12dCG8120 [Ipomoea batatas]GMD79633.1 hypothetical protein Iba_chr13dCG5830 [Ipomoea batatas]
MRVQERIHAVDQSLILDPTVLFDSCFILAIPPHSLC